MGGKEREGREERERGSRTLRALDSSLPHTVRRREGAASSPSPPVLAAGVSTAVGGAEVLILRERVHCWYTS